jgi:DNA-directed RNA polymerase subunit H (RpoH/RPB5)
MEYDRVDKCKEIILEMFEQRGYTNIKIVNENCDDKKGKIIAKKQDGNLIYAFTKIIEKLNIDEINSFIKFMHDNETEHILIIYEDKPTPAVKNITKTMDLKLNIELFHADDLQYNVTKHDLVPQHVKLSKTEAIEFKNKYGIKIPYILKNVDPVSKFYDFKRGDIIKIVRKDNVVYYRMVV